MNFSQAFGLKRAFVSLVTVASVGLLGSGTVRAANSLRIGVVNLNSVFQKYKKKRDLESKLEVDMRKRVDILKRRREELARLKEEIELYDLGSDARLQKESEHTRKKAEYEAYRRVANEERAKRYAIYLSTLYDEIRKKIENYGRRHGFDLILKADDTEINYTSIDTLRLKIELRSVLFHSSSIDVTEAVAEELNRSYLRESEEK